MLLGWNGAVTTWELDGACSFVHFAVRHMGISTLRGRFDEVDATFTIDGDDLTRSRLDLTVYAASISTNDRARDERLRNRPFLDAASHPLIRFVSTGVMHGRPGGLRVRGDLTIRGITKPVLLLLDGPTPPTSDREGYKRIGLAARTTITRSDFGLDWNATLDDGRMVIGERISVALDAQFRLAAMHPDPWPPPLDVAGVRRPGRLVRQPLGTSG